jgi:glyoxylase-like metal-dependent hydrolase (beta-lactamase superfamily II)
LAGALAASGRGLGADSAAGAGQPSRWKGKHGSKVKRWDIVTIGNLSRNRYWGESNDRGVRAAICTCTLICGEGFRLLVDPSLADAGQMARELDRRAGLKLQDINALFLTHEHGDHWAGLAHFPDARWWAAAGVAEALNQPGKLKREVERVAGRLFDAIEAVPTPGHTPTHHSLRFDCAGLSVVIAGDAVATQDFFRERRAYFNAIDFELSSRTMDKLAAVADLIVPGHDNYFLVESASP